MEIHFDQVDTFNELRNQLDSRVGLHSEFLFGLNGLFSAVMLNEGDDDYDVQAHENSYGLFAPRIGAIA